MNEFVQLASETAEGGTYGVGIMALYSVIGLLLVIAVLIILIVLLVVFSKILNAIPGKKSAKKAAPAEAETSGSSVDIDAESETVAAITAALMAYYNSGGKTEKAASEDDMPVPFVIRSIKKL
mgnify:CR=1 FL=1